MGRIRALLRAAAVSVLAVATVMVPGGRAGATYPGTAAGRIAFVRAGNIWTMAPDGTAQRRITFYGPTAVADSPHWSPDGKRIAFQLCKPYAGVVNCDIWTMGAAGANKVRVTSNPAKESDPTWSPDGRWLAFVSDRISAFSIFRLRSTVPFGPAIGVVLIPEECGSYGAEDCRAEHGGYWFGDGATDWSPDGTSILFGRVANWAGSSSGTSHEVFIAPVWSEGPPVSVQPEMAMLAPSWSPGGARVAFTNLEYPWDDDVDLADASNLFHVALDGSDLRQVTHYAEDSDKFASSPCWAPNGGRTIVYALSNYRLGTTAVYRVVANGTRAPVLLARDASDPDWQPIP